MKRKSDWHRYFARLYQATLEGFDRERARLDNLLLTGNRSPDIAERKAESAAKIAVFNAWRDAVERYPNEWQVINRALDTLECKIRDGAFRSTLA
jgi:hypothetical protein